MKKQLKHVSFSLKFIAPCQITTIETTPEGGDSGGEENAKVLTSESLHGAVLTLQSTEASTQLSRQSINRSFQVGACVWQERFMLCMMWTRFSCRLKG